MLLLPLMAFINTPNRIVNVYTGTANLMRNLESVSAVIIRKKIRIYCFAIIQMQDPLFPEDFC